MKKRIALIAAAVLAMGVVNVVSVRAQDFGRMNAVAIDEQPADLGAPKPDSKPKKKTTKKKTTKPKTTKKTTQKKPAKPKKSTAKKTTKKTAKKQAVNADKQGIDQGVSTTAEEATGVDLKPEDRPLPEVTEEPKPSSPAKGLTIAGIAGMSGLGLIYLLKKYFWP